LKIDLEIDGILIEPVKKIVERKEVMKR